MTAPRIAGHDRQTVTTRASDEDPLGKAPDRTAPVEVSAGAGIGHCTRSMGTGMGSMTSHGSEVRGTWNSCPSGLFCSPCPNSSMNSAHGVASRTHPHRHADLRRLLGTRPSPGRRLADRCRGAHRARGSRWPRGSVHTKIRAEVRLIGEPSNVSSRLRGRGFRGQESWTHRFGRMRRLRTYSIDNMQVITHGPSCSSRWVELTRGGPRGDPLDR